MGDSHDCDYDALSINPIDNPKVAHTDTPVIGLPLELLHTLWQRIFSETIDFFRDTLLHLTIQRSQLAQRRSRVLNCV